MISERVAEVLTKLNLSQNALSKLIGVSQSNVHAWLRGGNMPRSTAMAFQAALGVRWQWLLNGEGEMLLSSRPTLTDNEKTVLDLMGKLSDGEQKYLIGAARALVDAKKVK